MQRVRRTPLFRVGSKCWPLHRFLKPRDVGSIPTRPTKSSRTRSGADAGSTTRSLRRPTKQVNVSRSTRWCATPDPGVRLPSSAPCVDFTRSPPGPGCSSSIAASHESERPALDFTRPLAAAVRGSTRRATRERRIYFSCGLGRPVRHLASTQSKRVRLSWPARRLSSSAGSSSRLVCGRSPVRARREARLVSPLKLSWL